jgi:hypothetical protein
MGPFVGGSMSEGVLGPAPWLQRQEGLWRQLGVWWHRALGLLRGGHWPGRSYGRGPIGGSGRARLCRLGGAGAVSWRDT